MESAKENTNTERVIRIAGVGTCDLKEHGHGSDLWRNIWAKKESVEGVNHEDIQTSWGKLVWAAGTEELRTWLVCSRTSKVTEDRTVREGADSTGTLVYTLSNKSHRKVLSREMTQEVLTWQLSKYSLSTFASSCFYCHHLYLNHHHLVLNVLKTSCLASIFGYLLKTVLYGATTVTFEMYSGL